MLLQNAVAEADTMDRPIWKCVKRYKSIRKWNSNVTCCRHNNHKRQWFMCGGEGKVFKVLLLRIFCCTYSQKKACYIPY